MLQSGLNRTSARGRSMFFAIFSIDGEQLSKVIDEIDFNYVPIQEDVHFNLELLTRGYPNAIMEEFCYYQKLSAVQNRQYLI